MSGVPSEVLQVLETGRYNPNSIVVLEKFVEQQVNEQRYHPEANMALLKLYQFFPKQRNDAIMLRVLCKSLTRLSDFLPCLYLLPETMRSNPGAKDVMKMADALEACKFQLFWDIFASCTVVKGVPGLADRVRDFIGSVLAITYQQVPLTFVVQNMRFANDAEMDTFFSRKGWKREGNLVNIPVGEENTEKSSSSQQGAITFAKVAPLINAISH